MNEGGQKAKTSRYQICSGDVMDNMMTLEYEKKKKKSYVWVSLFLDT